MKVSKTGITLLDEALMDGVPKGFTILICGVPGSGTDLFAKQFASAGVGKENVVFFTTTETDEDIISTIEYFGWNKDIRIVNLANIYYENVLAKELEVSRFRKEGIKMKDVKKPKEDRIRDSNLLTTLVYEVSKVEAPFRIVVHSLDFFFEYHDHADVLSAIRTIKAHTQRSDSIALFTLDTDVLEKKIQIGVEEIVDSVIELERERDRLEFNRNLIIKKFRNHPEKTGILPFSLTKDGIGSK
jgi:KaiC/GvpD/RAD55 family RecA-like ATPase